MSFCCFGTPISKNIAIGQAIIFRSMTQKIQRYLISPENKTEELNRLQRAHHTVLQELKTLQQQIPQNAPAELSSILDVHMMLLNDLVRFEDLQQWITEHSYNAEWALDALLKDLLLQFNSMESEYFKQRGADVEQIIKRLQTILINEKEQTYPDLGLDAILQRKSPFIIVANDITVADMLRFKNTACAGFVLDTGGLTSHNAIIARSMNLSALFGTQHTSELIHQNDWLIIDGQHGVVIVSPSKYEFEEYRKRQLEFAHEQERLDLLRDIPAQTLDQEPIELLANIDTPEDCKKAKQAGAAGIGLFRTEFLFIAQSDQQSRLPDEEMQYEAYSAVLKAMPNQPIIIRTIDIRADKTLDDNTHQITPSTGATLFRTNVIAPEVFQTQLRALLRASVYGDLHILVPMLSHEFQIHQTLGFIAQVKNSLTTQGIPFGKVKIGAMIEVPAAVLTLPLFIQHFDFFSIGTNDLIQYTLAVDRTDENMAHLFDSKHPAVLQMIASIITQCNAASKKVSVCGEMGGDVNMTRLLLGLGLRSFSMHPAHIPAVKNELLHSNIQKLTPLAQKVIQALDKQEQDIAFQSLQYC